MLQLVRSQERFNGQAQLGKTEGTFWMRESASMHAFLPHVLVHLSVSDVANVAHTCKEFQTIANSTFLWTLLAQRDFHEQCDKDGYKGVLRRPLQRCGGTCDMVLRFGLIGDAEVGKFSLVRRYIFQFYRPDGSWPSGVCDLRTTVSTQGKTIAIEFNKVSAIPFDGIVLMYDQTNPCSFRNIGPLFDFSHRVRAEHAQYILCVNKTDLPAVVPIDDGQALASKLGMPLAKISCKTNQGIEEAIAKLVRRCLAARTQSTSRAVCVEAEEAGGCLLRPP